MAVSINQTALNNSSGTLIGVLGPGETAYVSSVTAAATIYVGLSSGVSTSTGFPLATGNPPLPIVLPVSSPAVNLYALGSGSVNAAVLIISRS